MDTDELSIDAYEAIINEAEKFNHDLTLNFGLIAKDCLTEDESLESAIELIEEFNTYTVEDLPDIFYDGIPDLKSFIILSVVTVISFGTMFVIIFIRAIKPKESVSRKSKRGKRRRFIVEEID